MRWYTVHGKKHIPVSAAEDLAHGFQFDAAVVDLAKRYRFFIRSTGTGPDGLLAEVKLAWDRQLEDTKGAAARDALRPVDALELISLPEEPEFWQRNVFDTAASVETPSDPEDDFYALRVGWPAGEARDGGVQVIAQDCDDTTRWWDKLVEVRTEDRTRLAARDFSDAEMWVFPHRPPAPSRPKTENDEPNLLAFYWDESQGGVLAGLAGAAAMLLGALSPDNDWQKRYAVGRAWCEAAAAFLADGHNDFSPAMLDQFQQTRDALKVMLSGVWMPGHSFSEVVQAIDAFLAAARAAQYGDASAFADDQLAKNHFLDVTTAKRLASILEHRLSVARQMLDHIPWETLEQLEVCMRTRDDAELCPRSLEWREAVDRLVGSPDRYPLCQWAVQAADAFFTSSTDVFAAITSQVDRFGRLAFAQSESGTPDLAKVRQRVTVIPFAAGLERLLRTLGPEVVVLRRPHHALLVERDAQSGTKIPIVADLFSYLPAGLRILARTNDAPAPPAGVQHSAETTGETDSVDLASALVPFFNLLERLGFALDVAVADKLGESLWAQESLIDWLTSAPVAPDCNLVVLAGREADSKAKHQTTGLALGFSFVKVVVIPRSLVGLFGVKDEFLKILAELCDLRSLRLDDATKQAVAKLADSLKDTCNSDRQVVVVERASLGSDLTADVLQRAQTRIDWRDGVGRNLRVAIRRVSRYEPLVRWARPDRVAPFAVDSILNEPGISWRFVSLKPIGVVPVAEDVPAPVVTLNHPGLIQAMYQLPEAARDALCSPLAQVRHGYRGVQWRWEYQVLNEESLRKILGQIHWNSTPHPLPTETVARVYPGAVSNLFVPPYERLVTLRRMPYFYEYRLSIAPLYAASRRAESRSAPSGAFARRRPARSKAWQAEVAQERDWLTFTVPLTTYQDNLADEEIENCPPPLSVDALESGKQTVTMPEVVDLSMSYQFLLKFTEEGEPLYVPLAEVAMPWHESHRDDSATPNSQYRPFVHRQNTDVEFRPEGRTRDVGSCWPEIQAWQPRGPWKYCLVFSMRLKTIPLPDDSSRLFMRAARDGYRTEILPVHHVGIHAPPGFRGGST